MQNTATIIFDFDGTLHDSMVIYRRALQMGYDVLVERGEAAPRRLTDDVMMANIGLTSQEAWGIMCPELSWDVAQHAAVRMGQVMDELLDSGPARLVDGVPEMLQQVVDEGHTPVFLSNCRNAYRDAVRCAFGFDRWFDHYYTAEQFDSAPKEVIFETIRQEVPGPYLVVGDRDKDVALAEAHGLPCIGCTYGYAMPGELDSATLLAHSPQEIAALIERI